jgi:hypothetical protein
VIILRQGSRPVENIFQLVGDNEDAITAALAWTMASSLTFLREFVSHSSGYTGNLTNAELYFQRSERNAGRTDLEIVVGDAVHIIFEAKKGWEIPTLNQLGLYAQRSLFSSNGTAVRRFVTASQADSRYASLHLPLAVNGMPLAHLSWRYLHTMVKRCIGTTNSIHEKKQLGHLADFLNRTMTKPNVHSNAVYVVSLGRDMLWPGTNFVDVVEKHCRYFHPVGGSRGGWPTSPPNYIAFRYDGELKSIHHVDDATVTNDLADTAPGKLPSYPVTQPHFLYRLGPAIRPPNRVPSGAAIKWSTRVWVALDLLLTSPTISDALVATKKRVPTS